MGLLDGGLQRVVAGVFGSFFLQGQLYRPVDERGPGGKVTRTGFGDPIPIRGMVDACTEAMINAPGYTQRSAQLIVLQLADIPAKTPITPDLTSNDQIVLRGERWAQFALISADPAQGAWTFRATPIG